MLGYVALSDRRTAPAAQTAGMTATATVTATATAPTTTDVPPAATTSAAPNPLAALQARAAADKPYVLATMNNRWVVQLASKYAGVTDDGRQWFEADILGEINYFESRYGPVKLLYSGEWPVFDGKSSWVPVLAAYAFTESAPAVAWCRQQNLNKDRCAAKLVSDTMGPAYTTAYP